MKWNLNTGGHLLFLVSGFLVSRGVFQDIALAYNGWLCDIKLYNVNSPRISIDVLLIFSGKNERDQIISCCSLTKPYKFY